MKDEVFLKIGELQSTINTIRVKIKEDQDMNEKVQLKNNQNINDNPQDESTLHDATKYYLH